MRNKGCIQPHLFASYLRLRTGRVGGEYAYWLLTEGIASLLGVSQVTLFRSRSVPKTNDALILYAAAYEKLMFSFFIGTNFFKDNFVIISSVCNAKR